MGTETGYHYNKVDQVNVPGLKEGRDFINPYSTPKDWTFEHDWTFNHSLLAPYFTESLHDIYSWLISSQNWSWEAFRKDHTHPDSPYFIFSFISQDAPINYQQNGLERFLRRGKPYLDLSQLITTPDDFLEPPSYYHPADRGEDYGFIHCQLHLSPRQVGPYQPDSNNVSQTLENVCISPFIVRSLRSTDEWLEDPTRMMVIVCLDEKLADIREQQEQNIREIATTQQVIAQAQITIEEAQIKLNQLKDFQLSDKDQQLFYRFNGQPSPL